MTIPTTGPLAEAQPDPMDRSSSRSSSSSEYASSSESDSDSSPYASDSSSDSDRRSSSSSSSSSSESESESEDELPLVVEDSKLGGEEENVVVDSSATDENSSEPMTIEETEDKEGQPETFGKVIGHHVKYGLVDKGKNEFEFLPKGWIRVLHVSGMPLYLHQETRVCTWSPPYSIGPKINVRKHEVPLSSIPCLKYWKELEKENFTTLPGIIDVQNGKSNPGVNKLEDIEEGEIAEDVGEKAAGNQEDGHLGGNEGLKLKNPQSVSTEENDEASALLDADSLREYCIKRFIIQKRTHAVFDSWRSQRAFKKSNRQTAMNGPQQALPGNPAVITLVAGPRGGGAAAAAGSESGAAVTRRKVINPAGKSYVSILHDVVFFNQGVYPEYKFVELADATNPFGATVVILGVEYASGYGASKRLAKINSAKGTLSILLPEYKNVLKIGEDETSTADAIVPTSRQQSPSDPSTSAQDVPNNHQDCFHFDTVEVEDPRISSMSKTLAKPIPSQILTTCMQRNKHNFGASEVENSLKPHPTNRKRILYTMKLAEHEVTVECKNKRDGKQLASQMMLKKLHPLVTHWAGLLKLYEVSEAEAARKKRHLAREVTKLQERKHGEGEGRCMNHALLRKLREEMLKAKKNQASPIPPFVVLSADVSLSPAMDSPVVAAEVKQDPVRGEEEGEIRDNLDYEPVSSESDSESSPTVPLFSAGSDFVIKEELVSDEEQENNQSSSNGYTRKVEGGRKRRRLEAN